MIKLTPLQVEIVLHRLTIPDAIHECLNDTYPDQFDLEDVCTAAEYVAELIREPFDLEALTQIEKEVFVDAIDGSTFTACADGGYDNGEISRQQLSAIESAYARLQRLI